MDSLVRERFSVQFMCSTLRGDWEWCGMGRFPLMLKNVARDLETTFGASTHPVNVSSRTRK